MVDIAGGIAGGVDATMIDRQKVETVLYRRFPGAKWEQIAAATNAIMGLDDEWLEVEYQDVSRLARELEDHSEVRLFRRVVREGTPTAMRLPRQS